MGSGRRDGDCHRGRRLLAGDQQQTAACGRKYGASAAPPQEMRETPSSRETLTRMGVTRDESNFRSAINRNDTRVALLFCRVGWTGSCHGPKRRCRQAMTTFWSLCCAIGRTWQKKPCRRFINTLSHAMSNGESLTSIRKEYLKAFCTVPAVVKRQKHDLEMATRRAQSQPDATTKNGSLFRPPFMR